MLRLCSRISIVNKKKEMFTLDFVKNVTATGSWDTMIDKATVTLPKKIYVTKSGTASLVSFAERSISDLDITKRSEKASDPLFEVGDKIKVELGYDLNYNTVLEGLITSVSATVPIVLECADPMWLMSRITMTEEVSTDFKEDPPFLSEVLSALQKTFRTSKEVTDLTSWKELKNATFEINSKEKVGDFPLNNFFVKDKTIMTVLEELKNQYSLYTFAVVEGNNVKISCGNFYSDAKMKAKVSKKFSFQNSVISENLVSVKETDVKVEVVVTNVEGQSAEAGDETIRMGGAQKEAKPIYVSVHNMNANLTKKKQLAKGLSVKEILNNLAERRLKSIRYNGYTGSFKTFGKPFVKHGDKIGLVDNYIPEREGNFMVKQVDYEFGDGGFKQTIHLHSRVD